MKNCEIISDCIKQIYKSRGIEVFDNASTFHALIGDLAPTQTTERRILRSVIDDSLLKQLSVVFKDDESDKEYEAIRIKRIIEDNNGLSEKWSEFIIGSFTTAAGIKLNAFSAENTKLDEFKNINETKIITENEYGQEQKFILSDGCTYVGNITNGVPNGVGKKMWSDGAVYVGEFVEGIKQGYGTFVFPDKRVYEGQFNDDKINGNGKLTTPDGKVYEGEFVKGKRTGNGRLMWPNGDFYEGEFVNGAREGIGKFIWSNGDTYEGEFTNGKMTGNGTMTKNGVRQSGYFENGILKSSNEQSTVSVNNSESEILKKKNILIQKKEALSKELKSLGVFDVKRKMEIRKQISSIDLELTLNNTDELLKYLNEFENGKKVHVMTVDDSFSIKGRGTVLVGKLMSERLNNGDSIIVNENNYLITAIEKNKKILNYAERGDYISILVRGLDKYDVVKGDFIYMNVT